MSNKIKLKIIKTGAYYRLLITGYFILYSIRIYSDRWIFLLFS